ncbi:unnamed protein product [Rotaria magnacalcarata]|uniref:Uncharacterized protein n=1 Tax=Rotaria magnacalcarata TaxID=392030 RepID=A0A816TST3_9BILA|nr:unnamed protein product [Rotaria magnacalcarata]
MEAVTSGSSIPEASNTFLVPYATLNSHVNNEVLYDQVGRPTKFSMEDVYLEQAVLAFQKRAALTSEQIKEWFGLLSKVIEENDLANCPAQLFGMYQDERKKKE